MNAILICSQITELYTFPNYLLPIFIFRFRSALCLPDTVSMPATQQYYRE